MRATLIVAICLVIAAERSTRARAQQFDADELAISCDSGHLGSCNDLAVRYLSDGQHGKAVELFDEACTRGLAAACSNLAEQYFDGLGVEQNLERSFELFRIGCNGNVASGCAGMCIVLAKVGQLSADMRPNCQAVLQASCTGGNRWMCGQELAQAESRRGYNSDCQGPELARSRDIIEYAWLSGLEIAQEMIQTDDLVGVINRLVALAQEMNTAAQQLPYACQLLIQEWSTGIARAYQTPSPSGTNCMGGVCCDQTGCY